MIDEQELIQSCIDFKKEATDISSKWKDATSYSRGDEKRIPTAFETHVGGMRVSITCKHIYYKGQWILFCNSLNFEAYLLKSKTAKEAAKEAILVCKEKAEKIYRAFQEYGE